MAKKAKVEKELRLEDILFNCRDQLRGKASMADKRDLLLALVFLRFVGEKFTIQREAIYNEQIAKGRDPETDVDFIASWNTNQPMLRQACFICQRIAVGKILFRQKQMRPCQQRLTTSSTS